ncbi:hypothetical protein [Acinetobacter bereziniae]|uniref:hypothetical protein n=1 Tax=Acinetobacter bereziniae TaxID=106648 RepID=UPI003016F4FB
MFKLIITFAISLILVGCVATNKVLKSNPYNYESTPISTKWVNTDIILVKDAPNGNEIDKLYGGNQIYIYGYYGNWARISNDTASPRWISTYLLCDYDGCFREPNYESEPILRGKSKYESQPYEYRVSEPQVIYKTNKPAQYKNTGSRSSSSSKTRPLVRTSSSYCPCSGNNYCVGPRGGHFCITSGGNKRYLPR